MFVWRRDVVSHLCHISVSSKMQLSNSISNLRPCHFDKIPKYTRNFFYEGVPYCWNRSALVRRNILATKHLFMEPWLTILEHLHNVSAPMYFWYLFRASSVRRHGPKASMSKSFQDQKLPGASAPYQPVQGSYLHLFKQVQSSPFS